MKVLVVAAIAALMSMTAQAQSVFVFTTSSGEVGVVDNGVDNSVVVINGEPYPIEPLQWSMRGEAAILEVVVVEPATTIKFMRNGDEMACAVTNDGEVHYPKVYGMRVVKLRKYRKEMGAFVPLKSVVVQTQPQIQQ